MSTTRENHAHLLSVSKLVQRQLEGCNGNLGQMVQALKCVPNWDVPMGLHEFSLFQLPINDIGTGNGLQSFWGRSQIPLVGKGDTTNPSQGLIDAYSDFSSGAALAAPFVIMGVGLTFASESACFSLPGVAVPPATNTTAVSPDAYLTEDLTGAGHVDASALKAQLEWGRPGWAFAEDICDGFRAIMRVGNTSYLIDEPVKDFASCGVDRYDMGFSSCQLETPWFVDQTNAAYQGMNGGNPLGAAGLVFVPTNVTRTGLVAAGTSSTFSPSREGERVDASFGAAPKHKLYTNSCWKIFDFPIFMPAGLPFQFFMQPEIQQYVRRALQQAGVTFNGSMSPTTGFGPAGVTIAVGEAASTITEWNDHAGPPGPAAGLHPAMNTIIFKGGLFKMETCFYGFSLEGDQIAAQLSSAALQSAQSGGVQGVDGRRYGIINAGAGGAR